jgi:hypothetical protein
MDRLETTELIELEQADRMALKPLGFDMSRFQLIEAPISSPEEKARQDVILKERDVVQSVYDYFAGQLTFGRIWNMVKRKGPKHIYECLNLVRQEPGDKPVGKFINKVEEVKVPLSNAPQT